MRIGRQCFLTLMMWVLCLVPAKAVARTSVHFWAPLTPFEREVLSQVEAARAGDAETLLALALMASGDIRTRSAFQPILEGIHQFIDRIRPTLEKQPSVHAKGETLLSAMHAHFFPTGHTGGDSELIQGYNVQQSQVSAIFHKRQFNCVSSAILFMVLARYFNMDVQGVVSAQHAFVQIKDEKNQSIEVETTSRRGFGIVHDKAFYDKSFAAFFISRNLEVPTYENYLKRRVLPPFRLIAENMNHQHTAAARMEQSTRQRLYEMMGFIDQDTPASQLIRLKAFHNEAVALLNARDTRHIERLSQIVEPVLAHVQTRSWIDRKREKTVADVREHLGSILTLLGHLYLADKQFEPAQRFYAQAPAWTQDKGLQRNAQKGQFKAQAFHAFDNHQWQAAISAYQQLIALLSSSEKELHRQTNENIAAAYWNWGNSASEQSSWHEAASHYSAVLKWTRKSDTIQRAKAAQTKADAMHHFNSGNWDRAIDAFQQSLSFNESRHQAMIRHNIGSAYINWGNALFYKQQYRQALDKYESALDAIAEERKNIVYQNIWATFQKITTPLINDAKVPEAKTIMERGVQRFPQCIPCQEEVMRLNELVASQKESTTAPK